METHSPFPISLLELYIRFFSPPPSWVLMKQDHWADTSWSSDIVHSALMMFTMVFWIEGLSFDACYNIFLIVPKQFYKMLGFCISATSLARRFHKSPILFTKDLINHRFSFNIYNVFRIFQPLYSFLRMQFSTVCDKTGDIFA